MSDQRDRDEKLFLVNKKVVPIKKTPANHIIADLKDELETLKRLHLRVAALIEQMEKKLNEY